MRDSEISNILKKLEDHERRLSKIEKILFDTKVKSKIKHGKNKYEGLAGGIRFLIDNGFLNTPRSCREVCEELKKEGYYYPIQSVNKELYEDFLKRQKILTRFKEGKTWKYVIRK